jgi:hypothetical protein
MQNHAYRKRTKITDYFLWPKIWFESLKDDIAYKQVKTEFHRKPENPEKGIFLFNFRAMSPIQCYWKYFKFWQKRNGTKSLETHLYWSSNWKIPSLLKVKGRQKCAKTWSKMKNSRSFGKYILHILVMYQLCSFFHELVYPTYPSPSALTLWVL